MRPTSSHPFTAAPRAISPAERLLHSLGADPEFVESVLGDLAEEYALRAARDGVGAARWWYAREALRSAPHLVRNAVRHGAPRERARLAACGAGAALSLGLTVVALLARDGPPARLLAGTGDVARAIIVNSVRPAQLPVRVLDAGGRVLAPDGVRYRWESGLPIAVSPTGVVTCARRGDAVVRASLASVATRIDVRCRPVRELQAATWVSLVAGGPARPLPIEAIGVDGRPVMELRGAVSVIDGSIATLDGASIVPRAPGETAVDVEVGDRAKRIRVLVHEPVRAFTSLRADQRLVAASVRLARGDTVRFAVPRGAFWLKYIPRGADEAPPTITVAGVISCTGGDGLGVYRLPHDEYGTYCVVYKAGASVTVGHGAAGAPVVEGALALERVERR